MHLEFTGLGPGASNENHEIILLNRYDSRGQYFSSTHSNKIIKTGLAKSKSLLKYTYVLRIVNRKILMARTKAYLSVSVFSLESSHFINLRTSLKIHIQEVIQRNPVRVVLMAQLQRSNRENTYLRVLISA